MQRAPTYVLRRTRGQTGYQGQDSRSEHQPDAYVQNLACRQIHDVILAQL